MQWRYSYSVLHLVVWHCSFRTGLFENSNGLGLPPGKALRALMTDLGWKKRINQEYDEVHLIHRIIRYTASPATIVMHQRKMQLSKNISFLTNRGMHFPADVGSGIIRILIVSTMSLLQDKL